MTALRDALAVLFLPWRVARLAPAHQRLSFLGLQSVAGVLLGPTALGAFLLSGRLREDALALSAPQGAMLRALSRGIMSGAVLPGVPVGAWIGVGVAVLVIGAVVAYAAAVLLGLSGGSGWLGERATVLLAPAAFAGVLAVDTWRGIPPTSAIAVVLATLVAAWVTVAALALLRGGGRSIGASALHAAVVWLVAAGASAATLGALVLLGTVIR